MSQWSCFCKVYVNRDTAWLCAQGSDMLCLTRDESLLLRDGLFPERPHPRAPSRRLISNTPLSPCPSLCRLWAQAENPICKSGLSKQAGGDIQIKALLLSWHSFWAPYALHILQLGSGGTGCISGRETFWCTRCLLRRFSLPCLFFFLC